MKPLFIFLFLFPAWGMAQLTKVTIVTSDVDNFWKAYDTIIQAKDSASQHRLLHQYYLSKGSEGLKALTQVRNYTDKEYVHAINNYPRFWKSVRKNTSAIDQLVPQVHTDIAKLEKAYPALKPATIYFAVGVFRTNGTTQGNKILIGSEAALADRSTYVDELPEWRKPFYREAEQINNLALLCTHEYIHTQQKPLVENLLSKCLYEGVAEFISCHVTGKASASPAIAFGKANTDTVISRFVQDLFMMSNR
jgi:hypothetical protein